MLRKFSMIALGFWRPRCKAIFPSCSTECTIVRQSFRTRRGSTRRVLSSCAKLSVWRKNRRLWMEILWAACLVRLIWTRQLLSSTLKGNRMLWTRQKRPVKLPKEPFKLFLKSNNNQKLFRLWAYKRRKTSLCRSLILRFSLILSRDKYWRKWIDLRMHSIWFKLVDSYSSSTSVLNTPWCPSLHKPLLSKCK